MGAFLRFGAYLGQTRACDFVSLGYSLSAWFPAAVFRVTKVLFSILECAKSKYRSIGAVSMPF